MVAASGAASSDTIGWRGATLAVRGAMTENFDRVVIGGGSGGLAAAQRAAEGGARAALVESSRLGGTCVTVGCVPKKISWYAAELGGALDDAPDYGFGLEVAGHDWATLKERRDAYVLRLNEIYAANLAKRKVELLRGAGRFVDARRVAAAGRVLTADHIVIATGGHPRLPAIPGAELGITSDGFFELASRPERVAVVGSSYIAIELSGIFSGLGADTALVLRGDTALKTFDDMLGEEALGMLRDAGVEVAHPPIGTVALSEKAARERYGHASVTVFRSSFVPLYHSLTAGKPRTHMKLVTAGSEQRIVGLHVVGIGADEMLQGFAVVVRMGATKKDFDDTVAIHPTSAEEFVTMR